MREPVSVVVPFSGDRAQARDLLARLTLIARNESDQLIVVDNSPEPVVEPGDPGVEIARAALERSSYYARNTGAELARCTWLLFIDADCRPRPSLLDDYFSPPPGSGCGVVAGAVVGASDQVSLAARYARSRGQIGEAFHLETGPHPAGVTANLLVNRGAWEAVGGFLEGVRSGADVEFCWRVQEAGWDFEHRPGAVVEHLHRDSVAGMARKAGRHAAGRAWVNRRYPGSLPRPRVMRPLVRGLGGSVVWLLRGQRQRALFKLLDLRWAAAMLRGYLIGDNRAGRSGADSPAAPEKVLIASSWPEGPAAADRVDHVEAIGRPPVPDRVVARSCSCCYLEDETAGERIAAQVWAWRRHPLRTLRLLRRRGRAGAPSERLGALAPAARRLARAGVVELVPTSDAVDRARLLAALSGAALTPARQAGATPVAASR